ncbi:hypothetical protein LCGC14_0245320 [marine sediment metagenome]|uniref:Uncharacterized protein n=1 Tax=marine sediment metagenome TaxID=412755 RepID=A0A0F9WQY9_9ZZZZ
MKPEVSGPIQAIGNNPLIPTHSDERGRGGYKPVDTYTDLENLPWEKRRALMLVGVRSYSDSNPALFWLRSPSNNQSDLEDNDNWELVQIGAQVIGGFIYKGSFSATTGLTSTGYTLQDDPLIPTDTVNGNFFVCQTADTYDFGSGNITFLLGDWVIWEGTRWRKLDQTSAVDWNVMTGIPQVLQDIGNGTINVAQQSDITILQDQLDTIDIPDVYDTIAGQDGIASINAIMAHTYSKSAVDTLISNLDTSLKSWTATQYYVKSYINSLELELRGLISGAAQGIVGQYADITERDAAADVENGERWIVVSTAKVYAFTGVFGQSGSGYWDFVYDYLIGAGDVYKVGTPVDNQVAVWTGDGTQEGTTRFTINSAGLVIFSSKFKIGDGFAEFSETRGDSTPILKLINTNAASGTVLEMACYHNGANYYLKIYGNTSRLDFAIKGDGTKYLGPVSAGSPVTGTILVRNDSSGFIQKIGLSGGGATNFFRADGSWASPIPAIATLTDAATVDFDCGGYDTFIAKLATARSTLILDTSNFGKLGHVNVVKTIAGDCTVTISGTGYKFVDIDTKAAPAASIDIVISQAVNLPFEFDFINSGDPGTLGGGDTVIWVTSK